MGGRGAFTSALCTVLVCLVVPGVAGCGGGDQERVMFTPADGERIASIRPVTPGWPAWLRESTLHDSPDGAETGSKWKDDDKLANLVVQVLGGSEGAHEWMGEFNALSRMWAEQTGVVTKDEAVADLGDEAWRLWVSGNGTQVTYHWRRDNLVVEAHVHCYDTCPADVDAAARAWADAIDAEVAR